MNEAIYVLEPLTVVVLTIAAVIVGAAVWLWCRESEADRRFAEDRRDDMRRARETREEVASMRQRMSGAKLDGTAANTGSMRKATL